MERVRDIYASMIFAFLVKQFGTYGRGCEWILHSLYLTGLNEHGMFHESVWSLYMDFALNIQSL